MRYTFRLLTPYTKTLLAAFLLHMPGLQAQPADNQTPPLDYLLQAEQLVSQCLGRNLSADSNQASLYTNRMGVIFQPHETGPDLQRFFAATLNRPDESGNWEVQVLQLHATQTLDSGSGVHVTGLLDATTTELLYRTVADLWTDTLGPDFTITTINTTRMPETYCDHAGNNTEVDGVWHEVILADQKLPEGPVLPPYLGAVGPFRIVDEVEMGRVRAGQYKFTFRENTSGYPEFVSVDCTPFPEPCGETLDTLKTALGANQEEDTTQRDAAIMSVLPPAYTSDDIREMQLTTGNGRETLVVQLEEVPAGATRTVRGVVICRRAMGSGADWECEYRFLAYSQTLSNGMTASIRSLDLSEAQVETMVAAVEDDIVNAFRVSISASDTGFLLSAGGPGIARVTARFDSDLKLTEKEILER